ncbi:PemK-like protein [compost metagenome]
MSFNLNRSKLQGLARRADAKKVQGTSVPDVYDAFKLKIWNVIDFVGNFDSYTMSNWVLFKDRWIHNHSYETTRKYNRGSILMVDLGAANFKGEPSYEHPCIVLTNRKNKLLIVPCSGGAFGRGYSDVIDSHGGAQGFKKDTGVQVGHLRWIHKNRVLYQMTGKASTDLMNSIDDYMLKLIPTATKRDAIIRKLLKDNALKEKEVTELKEILLEREKLLEELGLRHKELVNWVMDRADGSADDLPPSVSNL